MSHVHIGLEGHRFWDRSTPLPFVYTCIRIYVDYHRFSPSQSPEIVKSPGVHYLLFSCFDCLQNGAWFWGHVYWHGVPSTFRTTMALAWWYIDLRFNGTQSQNTRPKIQAACLTGSTAPDLLLPLGSPAPRLERLRNPVVKKKDLSPPRTGKMTRGWRGGPWVESWVFRIVEKEERSCIMMYNSK